MVNLYNADCLLAIREMEDNQFDLAIVDPPYGIGLDFQFKNGLGQSIHDKKEWNDSTPPPGVFRRITPCFKTSNYLGM